MAWPPSLPTTIPDDSTVQQTNHPEDHNLIREALIELVARSARSAREDLSIAPPFNATAYVETVGRTTQLVILATRTAVTLNGPTTITTLPAAYRPVGGSVWCAGSYDTSTGGSTEAGAMSCQINTAGEVIILSRVANLVRLVIHASWAQ